MKAWWVALLLIPWTAHADWMDYAYSLRPNAAAIDFLTNRTIVNLMDREPLETHNKSGAGILGAFSVTSMYPVDPGFYFQWKPVFTFASHKVIFNTPSVFLAETEFQVFRVSAGIGPDFGYSGSWGKFSLGVSLGYGYNYVSWSSPVSGGSMGRTSGAATTTLSYQKYITQNWAIQVLIRSIGEDSEVWQEALNSSQGFQVPVYSVSNMLSGFSFLRNF